MSPFRSSFPPQPRVYFRNLPLLPSRAPRNANISSILSTLRILPVATGVWGLLIVSVPLCNPFLSPLCFHALTNCFSGNSLLFTTIRIAPGCHPPAFPFKTSPPLCSLCLCGKPPLFSSLRTLCRSLRSFPRSHRLFSTTSGLFVQNARGGIPLRELVRCTEAQKGLFVSPLLATLTHSMSRKSFPCHSYENTRDGGATAATNLERSLPTRLPRALLAKGHSFPPLPLTSVRREFALHLRYFST